MSPITGIVPVLFFWVLAALLFSGKGVFMLPGYNLLPEEAKKKYDAKALGHRSGIMLFGVGCLVGVMYLGIYLNIPAITYGGVFLLFGVIIVLMLRSGRNDSDD